MRDVRKFKVAVIVVLALCILSIAYSIASEYFLSDIEKYIERRIYYERVISRKGLSLHEAQYWSGEGALKNAPGGYAGTGRGVSIPMER